MPVNFHHVRSSATASPHDPPRPTEKAGHSLSLDLRREGSHDAFATAGAASHRGVLAANGPVFSAGHHSPTGRGHLASPLGVRGVHDDDGPGPAIPMWSSPGQRAGDGGQVVSSVATFYHRRTRGERASFAGPRARRAFLPHSACRGGRARRSQTGAGVALTVDPIDATTTAAEWGLYHSVSTTRIWSRQQPTCCVERTLPRAARCRRGSANSGY